MNENVTCLLALLRECTPEERDRLAALAGTKVNYLYGLATCRRGAPNVRLAVGIEDASRTLNKETKGRTRIVTSRDLASMCSLQGLTG